MAGGDLATHIQIQEEHRLPLEDALKIADEVCQALEHADTNRVIHRDLKPGNVWLTSDGLAKLGDFRLAVALDRSRLTQAGMMVGTVSYMSPEQALGGEVTPRSDLYSLGCMLYELVTGRPPFIGDESVAIITQHLNTPPVAPSWHVTDCPPGLEALILRLLEKDPAKRPASSAVVRQMLAAVAQGSSSLQPSPARGEGVVSPPPAPREGEREGRSPDPTYRRVFIGREAELRQLQSAFDRALSGQGSLVAVVGEPGIGKTALCEQIATYAAVRGGKTLVGHSYEEGSLSLPYLAFIEALRTYVLSREPDRLKEELGTGAAEVARIVSEVRDRVEVELRPASDPDEDRWRLYQAVSGFLRNASAVQPLLIVLEDLHWADRGTLDLLVHLSRQLSGARLLIVGNYRDVEVDRAHPLSATLAELRRSAAFLRISLRGLTVDEVHRMMSMVRGQEVSWGRAEAVFRQTEGNPLFVQEVLRYLVEEGLVVREGGQYVRTDGTDPEAGIPEGLKDVIGKRLSRLSAECNRILTLASVIGRDFQLATLQLIEPESEDALVTALEEAVRVGVLEDQSRGGQVRFRFAHAFFRQTLYEEIYTPRRLRLHQQVARALEQQYAGRLEEHAAELAEHFANSSDPTDLEKAIAFSEMAAQRARTVYAYGEVAHHLQQALQILDVLGTKDDARRCDLLLDLAEALPVAGEPLAAAEEVAPQALALADALADRSRAFRACRLALIALRRYGGAPLFFSPAFQRWAERIGHYAAPGTREQVVADVALADARWGFGRRAETWELRLRAVGLARELGDPALLFEAAEAVADGVAATPEDEGDRQGVIEELLALPRDGVPPLTVGNVLLYGAWSRLARGDRPGAEARSRELEALAERTRDPYIVLRVASQAALVAVLDGELNGAAQRAVEIMESAGAMGMTADMGRRATGFIRTQLHLGRFAEMLDDSLQLQLRGRRAQYPIRIVLFVHLGRHDEARALMAEYFGEHAVAADGPELSISQLVMLLEAAILLADREAAGRIRRRLDQLRGVLLVGANFTCIARHLGAAAALLGDRDAARSYYADALELCGRVRFRPELALTHFQLAELLLDEANSDQPSAVINSGLTADKLKADALGHLDFAIPEFEAMKMAPSLAKGLALRERAQR